MQLCYLCTQPFQQSITWKSLLLRTFPKVICERCERKFVPIDNKDPKHRSLFTYNEAMKTYLHQYKFLQDVVLAQVFAETIHQHLCKAKAIIIPIPMHPEKKKERTFAHIDELLHAARIPFTHVLEKTSMQSQSAKTLEQRLNAELLFRLKEGATITRTTYMLVDDIRTTGTTLKHATKILMENGATEVHTFTLIKG